MKRLSVILLAALFAAPACEKTPPPPPEETIQGEEQGDNSLEDMPDDGQGVIHF